MKRKRTIGTMLRMLPSLFVSAVLLFPPASSVLCIAPGQHIAIEDAGNPCCVPSDISSSNETSIHHGLCKENHCHDCTDVHLGALEIGWPSQKSHPSSRDMAIAADNGSHFSAMIPHTQFSSDSNRLTLMPVPVAASIPLRC